MCCISNESKYYRMCKHLFSLKKNLLDKLNFPTFYFKWKQNVSNTGREEDFVIKLKFCCLTIAKFIFTTSGTSITLLIIKFNNICIMLIMKNVKRYYLITVKSHWNLVSSNMNFSTNRKTLKTYKNSFCNVIKHVCMMLFVEKKNI